MCSRNTSPSPHLSPHQAVDNLLYIVHTGEVGVVQFLQKLRITLWAQGSSVCPQHDCNLDVVAVQGILVDKEHSQSSQMLETKAEE